MLVYTNRYTRCGIEVTSAANCRNARVEAVGSLDLSTNPVGYRLAGIALHVTFCVSVFAFLRRLLQDQAAAGWTTVVFVGSSNYYHSTVWATTLSSVLVFWVIVVTLHLLLWYLDKGYLLCATGALVLGWLAPLFWSTGFVLCPLVAGLIVPRTERPFHWNNLKWVMAIAAGHGVVPGLRSLFLSSYGAERFLPAAKLLSPPHIAHVLKSLVVCPIYGIVRPNIVFYWLPKAVGVAALILMCLLVASWAHAKVSGERDATSRTNSRPACAWPISWAAWSLSWPMDTRPGKKSGSSANALSPRPGYTRLISRNAKRASVTDPARCGSSPLASVSVTSMGTNPKFSVCARPTSSGRGLLLFWLLFS